MGVFCEWACVRCAQNQSGGEVVLKIITAIFNFLDIFLSRPAPSQMYGRRERKGKEKKEGG